MNKLYCQSNNVRIFFPADSFHSEKFGCKRSALNFITSFIKITFSLFQHTTLLEQDYEISKIYH